MWRHWSLIAGVAASILGVAESSAQAPPGLDKLKHLLVIYLENHSFDSLFGEFPGARGLLGGAGVVPQRGLHGNDLPNKPTVIATPINERPGSAVHTFYTNRAQIRGDKNRNDLFAAYDGDSMRYYREAALKHTNLWTLAQNYRLLDNFFQGAFGGSFLNHHWLICACAPKVDKPPADEDLRSQLDDKGRPDPPKGDDGGDRMFTALKDGSFSAESNGTFAVNTVQSELLHNGKQDWLLPALNEETIGNKLDDKHVKWAWYTDDWKLAGKVPLSSEDRKKLRDMRFQWHHQPFAYYERYQPGSEKAKEHLKDTTELEKDIKSGDLPTVAFYKPGKVNDQHPGHANLTDGDKVIGDIVGWMQGSEKTRDSYAIIITYDENGGFYDHMPPPEGPGVSDYFGPGSRVPAIIVSPFVRKGVEPIQFETTSILKLITEWKGLDSLKSPRLQAVNSLSKAFDFQQ